MPSLYEGFGIAAIEGLAMGLPAILTEVSGLCDFRKEYDDLIYAAPCAESLHDALLTLLLEPSEYRLKRSASYHEISKRLYSVENGVSGYFNIYRGK
jgi:glycosyltransferase involved in cell wall biosynthesis